MPLAINVHKSDSRAGMDVLLLGAAAIVLIALTVWIVWRPSSADAAPGGAVRGEEGSSMLPPQGDTFEDQYTSATADLSPGGVAAAEAELTDYQRAAEPWSDPALAREGAQAAMPSPAPQPALPAPSRTPRTVTVGAVVLIAAGGAAAGVWLYSRRQKQRNRSLERLRRRFR